MSSFFLTWNRQRKICVFPDILDYNKVTLYCLKCSTMDPWLKLKFQKQPEIGIWTFLGVFSVQKCHLSARLGMLRRKYVYFQISLTVTKSLFVV